MAWLPIALATAVAFGLYTVFIKLSAPHIDQVLGAVLLQGVAALIGGGLALALRAQGHTFAVTREGMWLAAAAGVCVGLAEIGTFVVFSRGAPVALASPVILGGSVAVAALVGIAALREPLRWWQGLGLVLVVVGVVLLTAGARR